MNKVKIILDTPLNYDYIIYENGVIFNKSSGREVKPYNDPRRPGECPGVYLQKEDGKRAFIYHDQLMAKMFIPGYEVGQPIHHLDKDVTNCSLSNLSIDFGLDALHNIHHETKKWREVDIRFLEIPKVKKLYYTYFVCEDGRVYNATTDAFIKPFIDKREGNANYQRVNFYIGKKSTQVIHVSVSRLVAYHFIPKPKGKDIVIFKDGNPENVSSENLYWGDRWDTVSSRRCLSRSFFEMSNDYLGKEKWVPLEIKGIEFEDEYLVSSFGRIWNETKQFYPMIHREYQANANNQYHQKVSMNVKGEGYREFAVHRIIAFMFCDNDAPDVKTFVNHINGNPECNIAMNLEWCTPYENLKHAIDTNLSYQPLVYESRCDEKYWKLNTILAWIFSIPNIKDDVAYRFYTGYKSVYNDNIPELSFDEFFKIFEEKKKSDSDFQKLFKYYKEEYGDGTDSDNS